MSERQKFCYLIRSKNGTVLNQNIQIYETSEAAARKKMQQMYQQCDVVDLNATDITKQAVPNSERLEQMLQGILRK